MQSCWRFWFNIWHLRKKSFSHTINVLILLVLIRLCLLRKVRLRWITSNRRYLNSLSSRNLLLPIYKLTPLSWKCRLRWHSFRFIIFFFNYNILWVLDFSIVGYFSSYFTFLICSCSLICSRIWRSSSYVWLIFIQILAVSLASFGHFPHEC